MSKNKKNKVVPLRPMDFSPEKYIKTQARSLPVFECLISEEWASNGISNIVVARIHKSGNITAGMYLVDNYCLGLKDTHYQFNMGPDEYEFLKENCGVVEKCSYILAHNLIYGAIAYAEDCGFKPAKDFEITQFILEEDDDDVELMELEFGFEGKPYYIKGPNDDDAKVNSVLRTLVHTVGEGNFNVLEDFEDEEDWYEEEDDDDFEDGTDEIEELLHVLKPVNKVYEKAIKSPEGLDMLKRSTIGRGYRIVEKNAHDEYTLFDDTAEEQHYLKSLNLFENSQFEQAIKVIKEAIVLYPHNAQFYNLLTACYLYSGMREELDASVIEMYRLFPRFITAMVGYANYLIENERPQEVATVFKEKWDLSQIYPERKTFSKLEAAIYYAIMCRYLVAVDDIDRADLYASAILKKDLLYVPKQTLVKITMRELCNAKIGKLKGMGF